MLRILKLTGCVLTILGLSMLHGQDFGSIDNRRITVEWSQSSGFSGALENVKLVFNYDDDAVRIQAYRMADDPFGPWELFRERSATRTDLLAWNGALQAFRSQQTGLVVQFATDRFFHISFLFETKGDEALSESFNLAGIGIFTEEFLLQMDQATQTNTIKE